jgi:hypothetical protein
MTPLKIPEILLNVGAFLDRDSLAAAVQVSKQFNQVLTPILYRIIWDNHPQPTATSLAKYAQHIHHLKFNMRAEFQKTFDLGLYTVHPAQCCNLKVLELTLMTDGFRPDLLEPILLVALNPNLVKLMITDQSYNFPRKCWRQMLSRCNRSLKELSFKFLALTAEGTEQLLALGPSLKRLSIDQCEIKPPTDASAQPHFPLLDVLKVNSGKV